MFFYINWSIVLLPGESNTISNIHYKYNVFLDVFWILLFCHYIIVKWFYSSSRELTERYFTKNVPCCPSTCDLNCVYWYSHWLITNVVKLAISIDFLIIQKSSWLGGVLFYTRFRSNECVFKTKLTSIKSWVDSRMIMWPPWVDACGSRNYIYLDHNLSYTLTLHSRVKSLGVLDTIPYHHMPMFCIVLMKLVFVPMQSCFCPHVLLLEVMINVNKTISMIRESRMDNPETQITLITRHRTNRTKQSKTQQNKTQ